MPASALHGDAVSLPVEISEVETISTENKSSLPSLEDFAWTKGEFRIVPYGAFWADMIFATERTVPTPHSLYVQSRSTEGEPVYVFDARRTRLGLDFYGPGINLLGVQKSTGRVEIDFRGEFVTENRATVLLRHAYWAAKNDRYRVLVGQHFDVISPLFPGMLDYSIGYLGGNIGFRRAQVRVERYVPLGQATLTVQASLNQNIVTDFPTDTGVRREPTALPLLQARAAIATEFDDNRTATLGFSGHIGETGFDFLAPGPPPLSLPPEDDARFITWSMNVDVHLPLSDRFGLQGEFFTGANLSTFLGGIGQGVCPCLRMPIRATGGWGEVWYDVAEWMHWHVGYGVDDPEDSDSFLGRVHNYFIFANVVFDVTNRLVTGFEVRYLRTRFHDLRVGQVPDDELTAFRPGEAVTFDWMIKFSF